MSPAKFAPLYSAADSIRFTPSSAPELDTPFSRMPAEVEQAFLRLFDGPPLADGEPYLAADNSLPESARILLVKYYKRILRRKYGTRRNYYQLYRN